MTSDFAQLAARIESLERIERENACLRSELRRQRRRLRIQTVLALATLVAALLVSAGNRTTMAQAGNNLFARVAELETKTQFFSVATDPVTGTLDLYVTGTNVHLLNSSQPVFTNGLGNLIIGQNSPRTSIGDTNERTGSHNLVIGERNNYTGVEGVVIGRFNTIDGLISAVIGGSGNTATQGGQIFGGGANTADSGHILGGRFNHTEGHPDNVVVGGRDNRALSAEANVVVGGERNSAGQSFNTVVGGNDNRTLGINHRTIIGGFLAGTP